MVKRLWICFLLMISMSLIVSADVTREELIQALIESTELLEEQKTLNEKLVIEVDEYKQQVELFQNKVSFYQNEVTSLMEPLQKFPSLTQELRTESIEIRNSFNDLKTATELQLTAERFERKKYRFIAVISTTTALGTVTGATIDRTVYGAGIGIGVGAILGVIDWILDSF